MRLSQLPKDLQRLPPPSLANQRNFLQTTFPSNSIQPLEMTECTNMFFKSSLRFLMTLWSWENLCEEPNMSSEKSFKFLSCTETASIQWLIFLTFLKSMLSSQATPLPTKSRSSGFNKLLLKTETCLFSTKSSSTEWWKEDS